MPSLQEDVDQGVKRQPASTITHASYTPDHTPNDQSSSQVEIIEEQPSPAATLPSTTSEAPQDVPSSLQSEAERDRAQQPSSTVVQPSIAVFQPDQERVSEDSAQPPPNDMQTQLQSLHQVYRENNHPSSTVRQASIQADQHVDDNSSLLSARQPDSSNLLQSTEVQQPADMSASLNDHQFANQPSSTIPLQSLEDAQQPHDDTASI